MNCSDRKRIKEKLAKDHICYVLITCAESSDKGEMEVEMTYEGDTALASYLLQGAQNLMEDQEDRESLPPPVPLRVHRGKVIPLS
jgi:hypothetical protein